MTRDHTPRTSDWIVASVSSGGAGGSTTRRQWALSRYPESDLATLSTDLERLKHEAIRRAMSDNVSAWWQRRESLELLHARTSGAPKGDGA